MFNLFLRIYFILLKRIVMIYWVFIFGCNILDNVICVGYDINKKVLFIVWVVVLGEMIFGKCGIYFEGVYIFFVGKEYII